MTYKLSTEIHSYRKKIILNWTISMICNLNRKIFHNRCVRYFSIYFSFVISPCPSKRQTGSVYHWKYTKHENFELVTKYCGLRNFRGVPIFVVFVEGAIHEFQYQRISDFLYEKWRKILWSRILNPTNVSFSFNPRKLVPTKIKPSTVIKVHLNMKLDLTETQKLWKK